MNQKQGEFMMCLINDTEKYLPVGFKKGIIPKWVKKLQEDGYIEIKDNETHQDIKMIRKTELGEKKLRKNI